MSSFAELMLALDQAMVVVTTVSADGERDGCLVGFHGQASIDPPRYVVMLSDKNRTTRLAASATHLAVHAIAADQLDLASTMGELTADEVDKMALVAWHEGPHGLPILTAAAGWCAGEIGDRVRVGDHIAHLLDIDRATPPSKDFRPLTLKQTRGLEAGHEA